MNCKGCTCINQSHSKKQFCGKKITTHGKNAFFGCDTDCEPCKSCNYSDFATGNYKNYKGSGGSQNNNLRNYNNNNYENKGPLNKKGFLNFLKRQREMNVQQGLVKRNNYNNNEVGNNLGNNNNLENYLYNAEREDEYRNNNNNNNNNNDEIKSCRDNMKNNCYNVDGCYWDERGMECKDMEVSFFTVQGLENISFNLPIGNYDRKDVDNFDFIPSYILVPDGLRVKVWPNQGFVGNERSYKGNISSKILDPKMKNKLMYKLEGTIGSIQICNMGECIKPSQYDNLKLINILDGNNIDQIENLGVSGLEGYKNKLRQNIRNRLNFINVQYSTCLNSVKNYLKQNNIDTKNEIDDIEDIFELQKIKYILNNLPSCNDLLMFKNSKIDNKKNIKNNLDINDHEPPSTTGENITKLDLVNNKIFGKDEDKNKVSLLVIFVISLLVFLCIVLGIIQYKSQ